MRAILFSLRFSSTMAEHPSSPWMEETSLLSLKSTNLTSVRLLQSMCSTALDCRSGPQHYNTVNDSSVNYWIINFLTFTVNSVRCWHPMIPVSEVVLPQLVRERE